MISLNGSQVNAWRASQHYLLHRADRHSMLKVAKSIGGVQAQLMPAAELAFWSRLEGLSATTVQDALWGERSLVKTWAMRGTLHLLPAGELPLYVAARAAFTISRPPSYFTYHGVTPGELEAIIKSVPEVLSDSPITREQLAEAVAVQAGSPNLRQVLLSGWGALLKPSAFRGEICFGPSQGQNVSFALPSRWIGAWDPLDPQEALQEVARRYINAYGSATTGDFARWWGLQPAQAKRVFRTLGEEFQEVEVEGWRAFALASNLEQLATIEAMPSVRLLPQFDAYTMGVSRDCGAILPGEHKSRVYRPQGWISAVVLVDGRMAGTWEYEKQKSHVLVKVESFFKLDEQIIGDIESETRRLGQFMGAETRLVTANA